MVSTHPLPLELFGSNLDLLLLRLDNMVQLLAELVSGTREVLHALVLALEGDIRGTDAKVTTVSRASITACPLREVNIQTHGAALVYAVEATVAGAGCVEWDYGCCYMQHCKHDDKSLAASRQYLLTHSESSSMLDLLRMGNSCLLAVCLHLI